MRWFWGQPTETASDLADAARGPALCVGRHDEAVVVAMHVPLDASTASGLRAVVRALAAAEPERVVQLDLRRAARCSTGGLMEVARCLEQGARLVVDECSWTDGWELADAGPLAAGERS